jgi:uncharacterized protein YbcI
MATTEDPQQHNLGAATAAISNGIVQLFAEHYGRGPTRAKTYVLDDRFVVTVIEDTLTTVEQTLVDAGRHSLVRDVRLTFQETLADEFKNVVERELGREVVTYHSQIMFGPNIGFEVFVLADRSPD